MLIAMFPSTVHGWTSLVMGLNSSILAVTTHVQLWPTSTMLKCICVYFDKYVTRCDQTWPCMALHACQVYLCLICGDASQISPTCIEFPSVCLFSTDTIIKQCVSRDQFMPSRMGSITIADWLQQQIWGDIDHLQMGTQHDTSWNAPEVKNIKTDWVSLS